MLFYTIKTYLQIRVILYIKPISKVVILYFTKINDIKKIVLSKNKNLLKYFN